jgi:hypothetical protein
MDIYVVEQRKTVNPNNLLFCVCVYVCDYVVKFDILQNNKNIPLPVSFFTTRFSLGCEVMMLKLVCYKYMVLSKKE